MHDAVAVDETWGAEPDRHQVASQVLAGPPAQVLDDSGKRVDERGRAVVGRRHAPFGEHAVAVDRPNIRVDDHAEQLGSTQVEAADQSAVCGSVHAADATAGEWAGPIDLVRGRTRAKSREVPRRALIVQPPTKVVVVTATSLGVSSRYTS